MNRDSYIKMLSLIIWGYIFIYFNLNIGSFDILPGWVGYIFIYNAICLVGAFNSYVTYLKPLCFILIVWNVLTWIPSSAISSLQYLQLIMAAQDMYLNFMLLTMVWEIANIPCKRGSKRLIQLRNVRTILSAILAVPILLERHTEIKYAISVAIIIISIWICGVLYSYKKDEEPLTDV